MLLLNIRIRYKIDFTQCYTNGDDEFLTNPLASEILRFLLKYQLVLGADHLIPGGGGGGGGAMVFFVKKKIVQQIFENR